MMATWCWCWWCCILVVVVSSSCLGGAEAAGRGVNLGLTEPYVYEGGQRCDVDSMCLVPYLVEDLLGVDALGDYIQARTHYHTMTSGSEVVFSSREYGNGVQVFSQDFPDGLQGTSTGDKNGVSTCYPCLTLPSLPQTPDLRYVTPGGYMAGWTLYSQGSVATDLDWFRDGEDGGLVILFSGEIGNVSSLVISPLTQPMETNVRLNRGAMTLEYGVKGQAESIPPGYSSEVILYRGNDGIGRNIMAWGEALRTFQNTQKEEDPSAEELTYYTDNGSAHYYNPLPFRNFHEAIMSVYNYSVTYDLPIRRLQLDSWWYHKGSGGGVKNWTEIEAFLPEGIDGLYEATGWPVVAHNRYFSSDTDYAQQNGGPYLFTMDEENEKSLPLEKVFWEDLFDSTVDWGMKTYEQDWLDRQYMFTSALHTNLTLASRWLNDMSSSALERGLNIQYCMAFVRHLLHSLTLPPVTQIRVSDDYMLNPNQWRIGVTSLLAHALALRPYKDVFWTSIENENNGFVDCDLVLPDIEHPWKATHQYGGRENVSASGKPCVHWRDFGWDDLYFGSGMYENFCRNPQKLRDGAFCYTRASFDIPEEEWEWEYCDVPRCQLDCYIMDGGLYIGQHNVTQSGLECADWNGDFDLNGTMCRNPDNDVAPWCYTNEDHTERDYCDNKCPEGKEDNPNLQAAVSTLTAGPFGVGDRAENLDIPLIRKSISADGRLLHPSKPLTVVDGYFFSDDFREVWTAYSEVSSTLFGVIFLAEIGKQLTLTPWDLNLENAFKNSTMVFSNYPSDLDYINIVSNQEEAIELPYCGGYHNFCLLYTTPRILTEEGELYILGELDKWVPVSPNRIESISIVESSSSSSIASSVVLSVRGVQSEVVTLSFTGVVDFTITCVFEGDGVMTVDTLTRSCDP